MVKVFASDVMEVEKVFKDKLISIVLTGMVNFVFPLIKMTKNMEKILSKN